MAGLALAPIALRIPVLAEAVGGSMIIVVILVAGCLMLPSMRCPQRSWAGAARAGVIGLALGFAIALAAACLYVVGHDQVLPPAQGLGSQAIGIGYLVAAQAASVLLGRRSDRSRLAP